MRRYSPLQAIPLSLFSRDLYREVARAWSGAGLLYMLILSVLSTLAAVLTIQIGLGRYVDREASKLLAQLPAITVDHGVVKVDAPTPILIRDPTGKTVAIIDTSGRYTSLDGTGATLLLTKNRIFYAKNPGETRMFDLSKVVRFDMDRTRAMRWARNFAAYCGIVLAPFILLGIYAMRLIQQVGVAAIGLAVSRSMGIGLEFATVMRLTAVAFTPSILLETLLDALRVKPGIWAFLWVLLALAYLYFALASCRADAASEPAPDQPAAGTLT